MRVRLKTSRFDSIAGAQQPGDEIDVPDKEGGRMIAAQIAEAVVERAGGSLETATVQPVRNAARRVGRPQGRRSYKQ